MQTKQYYKPMWVTILKHTETYENRGGLASGLNVTYSHLVKILNDLENKGLVSSYVVGRKRVHKLTIKGKKVLNTPLKDLKNPMV